MYFGGILTAALGLPAAAGAVALADFASPLARDVLLAVFALPGVAYALGKDGRAAL